MTPAIPQPLTDLEIQVLWHLYAVSERNLPLHIAELHQVIGGSVGHLAGVVNEMFKRGLVDVRWFVCHLTVDGREALLNLIAAGKCRDFLQVSCGVETVPEDQRGCLTAVHGGLALQPKLSGPAGKTHPREDQQSISSLVADRKLNSIPPIHLCNSPRKPMLPEVERCDCGELVARHCPNCGKGICQRHGYLLQEGEPASPVVCGPCKDDEDLEQMGIAMYGKAEAR